MSKKRKYQRQSATNPAQIRASHPRRLVPAVIDNGDGTSRTMMVSEEYYERLQRKQTVRVKAEAEDGTSVDLTVGAPAGNVYAEVKE